MKNKTIGMILISCSCILFLIAILLMLNLNRYSFTQNVESPSNQSETNQNINDEEQSSESKPSSNPKEEENIPSNPTPSDPIVSDNPSTVEEEKPDTNVSNVQPEMIPKQETDVIAYFEQQDNMIVGNINQDDRTFREKAKDAFVTAVDFIFYDKEIKGYTFQELTTSAKLKVIKLALSIDHKIDEYFPDYKEVIKDKYTNIKGKLAVKYLEFTSSLCEKVGADTCNQAKEDFNNMKNSFHITWELIKELASSGSSKVKEFYESWRDSE